VVYSTSFRGVIKIKYKNMSCNLSSGYSIGCRDNIGGIQEVYIGEWNSSDMTFSLTASDVINAVGGATVSFYTFQQEIETGEFNQEPEISNENGTVFYNQNLTISLHKLTAEMRNQLLILTRGKWRIIIKDQRGEYWLMGYINPVRVASQTVGVGKAYGDLNGATITFLGKEREPAHNITAAAALSLIA
jgi:hypothetical protein